MQVIKQLWKRFSPSGRRALRKRHLENVLRDVGLSRSVSRAIVSRYFTQKPTS